MRGELSVGRIVRGANCPDTFGRHDIVCDVVYSLWSVVVVSLTAIGKRFAVGAIRSSVVRIYSGFRRKGQVVNAHGSWSSKVGGLVSGCSLRRPRKLEMGATNRVIMCPSS